MKLIGIWLIVIVLKLLILCIGMLKNSKIITFIGIIGAASGSICGVLTLLVIFIESKKK